MTLYDEHRVVTLLREVDLPQAPPDRLGEVRRRARRSESRRASGLAGVMAVVLAAGVVSAVSLNDRSNTQVLSVAGAAKATSAAGSALLSMSFEIDSKTLSKGGFPTRYTVSGPVDFLNKRAALKGTTMGQQVELRIIGKDRWTKVPTPVGSGEIGGKPWIHSVESSTDDEDLLAEFPDPSDWLEQLKSEGTVLSTRQVGDRTRTFLRMPLKEGVPAELRAVQADVTVDTDSDGLIRVMKSVTAFQEVRLTMTLRLDDFGIEVDVQPPPADQVSEDSEVGSSGSSQTVSGGLTVSSSPEDRQRACDAFNASRAQMPPPQTDQEKAQRAQLEQAFAQICKK